MHNLQGTVTVFSKTKISSTLLMVSLWSLKKYYAFILIKGKDRLVMVVELKVKNCREKPLDSFDTNMRYFYGVQFLKNGA